MWSLRRVRSGEWLLVCPPALCSAVCRRLDSLGLSVLGFVVFPDGARVSFRVSRRSVAALARVRLGVASVGGSV
jgi:hypothetical protein